jgi:hypothetical protein
LLWGGDGSPPHVLNLERTCIKRLSTDGSLQFVFSKHIFALGRVAQLPTIFHTKPEVNLKLKFRWEFANRFFKTYFAMGRGEQFSLMIIT